MEAGQPTDDHILPVYKPGPGNMIDPGELPIQRAKGEEPVLKSMNAVS